MPKAPLSSLPVSALFAIAKPSGPTCMFMLDAIKPLLMESRLFASDENRQQFSETKKKSKRQRDKFMKQRGVKVGQGGTLDPLADGVLVIGVNKGTKRLQELLMGPKDYRTTALLGCETDTYDSHGSLVRTAPWSHITREKLESVLDRFRGEITQLPPIYSALKMDGKALYDYAREGIPLPRPIESRKVTVYSLNCVGWEEAAPDDDGAPGHRYSWPTTEVSQEEKEKTEAARSLLVEQGQVEGAAGKVEAEAASLPEEPLVDHGPPIFQLEMTVSSGTYVRTLVHDIGHALGSAAHVVSLTRTRQGDFSLEGPDGQEGDCVDWDVFEKALDEMRGKTESEPPQTGEWKEWESLVRDKLVIVEDTTSGRPHQLK